MVVLVAILLAVSKVALPRRQFSRDKNQSILIDRRTKDDDWTPAATGRGDAPSASGTGERVRARVLLDGAEKGSSRTFLCASKPSSAIDLLREEVYSNSARRDTWTLSCMISQVVLKQYSQGGGGGAWIFLIGGARAMSIAHEKNRHTHTFFGGGCVSIVAFKGWANDDIIIITIIIL